MEIWTPRDTSAHSSMEVLLLLLISKLYALVSIL